MQWSSNQSKLDNSAHGLSLSEEAKALQMGMKITRSIAKFVHTDAEHPSPSELEHYHGQPSLADFLQRAQLPCPAQPHLHPHDMRRLHRGHLPSFVLLWNPTLLDNQLELHFVNLLPNKAKSNEFLIKQSNSKSRIITPNTHLCVMQTLTFYALDLPSFQLTFQKELQTVSKQYQKHLKAQQMESISFSHQQNGNNTNIRKDVIQLQCPINAEQVSFNVQIPFVQVLQQIPLHKIIPLDISLAIFNRLAINSQYPQNQQHPKHPQHFQNQKHLKHPQHLQNQQHLKHPQHLQNYQHLQYLKHLQHHQPQSHPYVLWPSIMLQPLNSSPQQLRNVLLKSDIISSNVSLLRKVYQDIVSESPTTAPPLFALGEHIHPEDILLYLTDSTSVVHARRNIYKWQSFTEEQLAYLTRYSDIWTLNKCIKALNEFKELQNAVLKAEESNQFFYRMCIYKDRTLCIPIRYEGKEKRVLVRMVMKESSEDERPGRQSALQWVPLVKVRANYTLPKATPQQRQFYFLIEKCISVSDAVEYLLSAFHYKPVCFESIQRHCFPPLEQGVTIKKERCIYCSFMVHDLAYVRCPFCNRVCHEECTTRREGRWNCEECEPCAECYQAVEDNYLKCCVCYSQFHQLCGRLKGVEVELAEKYTCEGCLKCKICTNRLKNQEYCVEGREIFCVKCYKDYKSKDFCSVCVKQIPGKWIQCDRKQCLSWVHAACDPVYRNEANLQTVAYWCPRCRILQRRKLLFRCIQQLAHFDECQYFVEADYENLLDYSDIVPYPMCLAKMKQKAIEGAYDVNPFRLVSQDFTLIISNAMTYNMPKQLPHYKAKMLNIMGCLALNYFKEIIECPQQALPNVKMIEWFERRKKQLYIYIHQHFLQLVLNHKNENAEVRVRRNRIHPLPDKLMFQPRYILNQLYADAQISIHFKKKPQKIDDLFTSPKLQQAYYLPIRGNRCFYHPTSQREIISSCDLCCVSFCCIKECFEHKQCSCGSIACNCDAPICGCGALKPKEKKMYEQKIKALLPKYNKKEVTRNYQYCLKCVNQHIKSNWCYLCKEFLTLYFQQCKQCSKYYHIDCEVKSKASDSPLVASSPKLPFLCIACSLKPTNADRLRATLVLEVKRKLIRLSHIAAYEQQLKYVYSINEIRITTSKLAHILLNNYQTFAEYLPILEEFKRNFPLIKEIVQFKEHTKKQCAVLIDQELTRISLKLHHQASTHLPYFHKSLDLSLTYSIKQCQLISPIQDYIAFQNFKINRDQRSFQLIKYIAYYQYSNNTAFKDNLQHLKYQHIHLYPQTQPQLINQQQGNHPRYQTQQQKKQKQCQQCIQYKCSIQYKCGKQYKCLLIQSSFCIRLNPFSQQIVYQQQANETSSLWRLHRASQLLNILTYLSNKLFQEDKVVLRSSNTCILSESPWRVLKRWGSNSVQIELYAVERGWALRVEGNTSLVCSVEQLIGKVQQICPTVCTFESLASFLGFTLSDNTYYEPLHFTHLLQTTPLDKLNQLQRKQIVQQVYDKHTWMRQGISCNVIAVEGVPKKYLYNVTKKKVFYLSRRDKDSAVLPMLDAPYITFEDIKRDLEGIVVAKNEHWGWKEPTNEVYVAPSQIHKLGLFVGQECRKNTVVVEYTGQTICEALADLRESKFHFGCYMFGLNRSNTDRREIIDATFRGNMARYLNHSCDPNCKARIEMVNDSPRIFIYTVKDIKAHEELTYDYQFKVDTNQKLVCMCKAKNCQGRLN